MKKFIKIMLCIMGSFIALIVVFLLCFSYVTNYKKTTCDTSTSPDGKYELLLQAIGEPVLFGSASGRLILEDGGKKISQTDFELHDDGGSISGGCWKVTWCDNYVVVVLSGEEQYDEQFILYFDGTIESRRLTDTEEDYVAWDKLDESRVIQEQSFDVELNYWGEVQFVSYLPSDEFYMEDVSFLLTMDNHIVYYFPAYFEDNSTENDGIGIFDSVAEVGFQDVNHDGLQDVIVIINYVTGAGPQGMLPRPTARIFMAEGNGFTLAEDLMSEIMTNVGEEDMSIANICKYIEEK